jgi:hypothetical protein
VQLLCSLWTGFQQVSVDPVKVAPRGRSRTRRLAHPRPVEFLLRDRRWPSLLRSQSLDKLIGGSGVIARPVDRPALSQITSLTELRRPEVCASHELFKLLQRGGRALLGDKEVARNSLRRDVGRIEEITKVALYFPVEGEGRNREYTRSKGIALMALAVGIW